MHVRRCARDLAERRRLEVAASGAIILKPAVAPRDSCIVEPLIREVRANVARHAVRLAAKELQAGLLLGRQRSAVALALSERYGIS